MKAHTAIIIDTRKPLSVKNNPNAQMEVAIKKNNNYPIKLRITFNRKQKYYPADINLTIEEFNAVFGKSPKGQNKLLRLKLDALEQKANSIIESMPVFDFLQFSKILYSDQLVRNDVYALYSKIIESNVQKGNLGTATNYNCSLRSLKQFQSNLKFIDVTVDFLEKYESSLLSKGKSTTTVSIYTRSLRSVINYALSDGTLSKDYNYPFGTKNKHKYQIPSSRNIKKALSLAEIKLFFDYKPEIGTFEDRALDFWIFSYLANGMNMKDVANLRYKDIDEDFIKFIRAKTRSTSNVVAPITVPLTNELKHIINKWGNSDKAASNLVFAIINMDSSLKKQRADLQQFIKMTNKYMKIIAGKLGIQNPCTTYSARHSFSTVMKRSGANVQYISEALGHSSINTTKAYLDSFEDDTKKEMAKALTAF